MQEKPALVSATSGKATTAAGSPNSCLEGERTGPPSVSVIVPCRNERAHILRFLDLLLSQERDFTIEILIADGMSDDGTRDVIQQYCEGHPEVSVIENREGIVSAGLNAAIRASRGVILIRMDVHTEYAPDYLQRCVEALNRTGADNVGGPWIAKGDGSLLEKAIAAAFQSRFCVGGARGHDPSYEGIVDTVYLGCWRRSVFDQIGLFDLALVRNQDDELNLRLTRSGGKIWQSPKICSWYRPRSSLSALFRQYAQYGFWKVKVICKHRAPASWRHIIPGLFVLANLALPCLFILAVCTRWPEVTRYAAVVWTIMIAIYLFACLGTAVSAAGRYGWRIAILLPLVIGVYHFSYGIGFVFGLFNMFAGRTTQSGVAPMFTRLTR
jgi:succinoglycan biosynthesis protein ExoA